MIAKILLSDDLIEEASALLYRVYIEEKLWKFEVDNPSRIRIEEKSGKKLLIDRFTDIAIWFGVFDEAKLVGCARLCGLDENDLLEIEGYPSSFTIQGFLPKDKSSCFELNKVAVDSDYLGRGVVNKLLLGAFEYCETNQFSVIACTHNTHLKSLLKKIYWPIKLEHAFRYEENDPMAVNFYFADYHRSEVKQMILAIQKK